MQPCKEELLNSIQSNMKLTKDFFMRIYGYELTWPGFADQAITALKKAGCNRAGEYYQRFVGEYEREHDKEMQQVAEWYRKQTERKGSGRDWKRQQEMEQMKKISTKWMTGLY